MQPTDLLPPEILEEDPLLDSAAQLEESARTLDLEDWIVQRLKHPEREIIVNLLRNSVPPLSRPLLAGQDGDAPFNCTGIRVQHFRHRAGCLGPVLLAPGAHLVQLRPLALHMTLQCALFDLPLGGSAGAIVCDPAQLTETELRQLVREYLVSLDLHDDIFVPADFPAAWSSRHIPAAAVVGKPAAIGGLPDPTAAIAFGWQILISEILAAGHGPLTTLHNCRVALQGFGPHAAALARLLHDSGARIVALADNSGGLFAERGLDLNALFAHVARHGMIFGFDAAEPVRNADVLECACDLLITAAAERQLTSQNAARIGAPLILEAVYNAVTPAAMRILASRGTLVVPGLIGAAPATLAWFAEWQHAIHHSVPEQARIESAIRDSLNAVFHRLHAASIQRKTNLADAGYLLALEKIAATLRWTR